MNKFSVYAFIFVFAMQANAISTSQLQPALDQFIFEFVQQQNFLDLDWKVGDSADYKVDMGMVKGDMHSFVREKNAKGYWIQQDMNMGPMGKQKIEILIDKDTGAMLELLVNGQRQQPPKQNMQVLESREEKVTVPAGTFDSMFLKIKNKDDNKITLTWINPEIVPIGGMMKTIAPGPMGEVKVDMTAYKKQ